MNLQPSEAEVGFDIRVPPTADPEPLERRIAEEWAPASRNMTFEVFTRWKFLSLKKNWYGCCSKSRIPLAVWDAPSGPLLT